MKDFFPYYFKVGVLYQNYLELGLSWLDNYSSILVLHSKGEQMKKRVLGFLYTEETPGKQILHLLGSRHPRIFVPNY